MSVTGKQRNIANFWVAGITYRTKDIATRSSFAVNGAQYSEALQLAAARGLKELFILSTCNRTEIYGYAPYVQDLTSLIAPHHELPGTASFHDLAYIKNGPEAVRHLYRVAAGLDSQILGDYEIVGQVKAAVNHSRKAGFIGTYLDRLINCALQSAKAIRTRTRLSNGTVSVAFAAVQYIKAAIGEVRDQKVLLIGTGKIGRNACKSLVAGFPPRNITVLNRTEEKARALAAEFGLNHGAFASMDEQIRAADIILVATNADQPIITSRHLAAGSPKLIIDLSIPNNVAPSVATLPGITLVNVDELSKIKDETLQQREAEVPLAELIITEHMAELEDWYGTRRILHTVQDKLHELHTTYYDAGIPESPTARSGQSGKNVHSIIASLAVKVKQEPTVGCHCIAAFNEFIGTPAT